jgi:plastocyanin
MKEVKDRFSPRSSAPSNSRGCSSTARKVPGGAIQLTVGDRIPLMKALVALLAAALLMAGCASSSRGSSPEPAGTTGNAIVIQGIAFAPDSLTVPVGAEVTWTNKDNVKHTVTSGKPGEEAIPGVSKGTSAKPTGVLDHAMAPSGSTFSFTFKKAGTYRYFCRIHSSMRGVIVVR